MVLALLRINPVDMIPPLIDVKVCTLDAAAAPVAALLTTVEAAVPLTLFVL
jgi:hypothetical protein